MDPITSAIVSALANLGAAAVKDAYEALKSAIKDKYSSNLSLKTAVKELEQKPKSEARKAVLQEEIKEAKADQDKELIRLAKNLVQIVATQKAPVTRSEIIIQKAEDNAVQFGKIEAENVNINQPARRKTTRNKH